MNTWFVGHAPVGHWKYTFRRGPEKQEDGTMLAGRKTFFMKSRIMAGQANLEKNKFGLTDFRWLAKEEIEQAVNSRYFGNIKNMLADR